MRRTTITPRRALLCGVSLSAMIGAGVPVVPAAMAGNPPVLSPAWITAHFASAQMAAALAARAGTGQTASAQRLAAQSTQNLSRMAAQIAAAQASQLAAAKALAGASQTGNPLSVPDGISAGGLNPLSPSTWTGATAPTQASVAGRTAVTIKQSVAQALLTWKTFNVGRRTDLSFDQSAGGGSANTWVALNVVQDPTAQPSQILGSITAPGKVYVVNRNGVIFGATSQVNVNGLIAASVITSQKQIAQILNASLGVSNNGTVPIFGTPGMRGGDIVVEAGAQLTTNGPASPIQGGGGVLLLGQNVTNAGQITTPNGQTLLGAGDSFVLKQGYSTTGNQASTTLGIEASIAGDGGSVTNTGIIASTLGDITLIGHIVTQSGVAYSTTSVNTRGTVHLLTSGRSDSHALVSLAPGSLTVIQPDNSSATALDSQRDNKVSQFAAISATQTPRQPDRADQSRIEITTGGNVAFGSSSLTMAQGGQVIVSAGNRVQVNSGATIDVSGQLNVALPMSNNNIAVAIQSYEQRDSPNNRDSGVLKNNTVYVDARQLTLVPGSSTYALPGTTETVGDRYYTAGGLLEVSGYLANTGHTIGEWTALGGSIRFTANEVVTQSGSVLNIGGGSLAYQGGYLKQSYVVGQDGRIYNVNTAPSNITYEGIFNGFTVSHPKWGITQTYAAPLLAPSEIYVPGYTVGRDAGQLTLSTPTAILEGSILAGVVNGSTQTVARPSAVTDGYKLPQSTVAQPGSLLIGDYVVQSVGSSWAYGLNVTEAVAGAKGANPQFATQVTFADDITPIADSLSPTQPLTGTDQRKRTNTAYLSASQISDAGLGALSVTTLGTITVAAPVTLAPGGSLVLTAPTVNVNAALTARGGSVTVGNTITDLAAPSLTGSLALTTGGIPGSKGGRASIVVAQAVTIDARGLWTNEANEPIDVSGIALVNGGAVTLDSTGTLALVGGSMIDASSGGAVLPGQKTVAGKGGNVAILGNVLVLDQNQQNGRVGRVTFDGEVRSFGAKGGGKFTLTAPQVVIGAGMASPARLGLVLSAGLFDQGFSSYDINGLSGLTVTAGTTVEPVVPVYQFTQDSGSFPTGSDPATAMSLYLPPLYIDNPVTGKLTERAGASLTLRSSNTVKVASGPLTVSDGAVLRVDAGQSIRLEAFGQITVNGTLQAPGAALAGGNAIAIVNTRQEGLLIGGTTTSPVVPGQSIWLGPNSVLDASARAATALDRFGRSYGTGSAPDAGSILIGSDASSVTSNTTFTSTESLIIIRPGATIEASGASETIDRDVGRPMTIGGVPRDPVELAGNGGTVALSSFNGIYIDGSIMARAGGAGGAGGTLSILLETQNYPVTKPGAAYLGPRTILISQTGSVTLTNANLKPGQQVPNSLLKQARIGVDQITQGGFDSVALLGRDALTFNGDVTLSTGGSIALYQGIIGDTTSSGHVFLSAPYVHLSGFTAFDGAINQKEYEPQPQAIPATIYSAQPDWRPSTAPTTATLTVSADQIDLQDELRFGYTYKSFGQSHRYSSFGFQDILLSSSGDIRFGNASPGTATSTTQLVTTGNVTLKAAQIYPETGVKAAIFAGIDARAFVQKETISSGGTVSWIPTFKGSVYKTGNAITIEGLGGDVPIIPDSIGGGLALYSGTVDQGGIVRAPEGTITIGSISNISVADAVTPGGTSHTRAINFLPGSETSVSADGQTFLYGGTTDGLTYTYNGGTIALAPSIVLNAQSVAAENGATLDLSGGGTLAGAGFIAGKGGSVDTLFSPLLQLYTKTGGTTTRTLATNPVFAVMVGPQPSAAPVTPLDQSSSYGGSVPKVGDQITLATGVDGLPAGMYTLLPAYDALLPGGYRIELSASTVAPIALSGSLSLGNGSYQVNGFRGTANTSVLNALPVGVTVTSGSTVRTYSQYDEEGYDAVQIATAQRDERPRPILPRDGKDLYLNLPAQTSTIPEFTFDGVAHFQGAADGYGGTVTVESISEGTLAPRIEITADDATPTRGWASVHASAIDALGASRVAIGGAFTLSSDGTTVTAPAGNADVATQVAIRVGATLSAPSIFLIGGSPVDRNGNPITAPSILVAAGAKLSTLGTGAAPYDSASGYYYQAFLGAQGPSVFSVVALSNGLLTFSPPPNSAFYADGPIAIQNGSTLYAGGSLFFETSQALTLGAAATYGARYITIAQNYINIGSAAALAKAKIPAGLLLGQDLLSRLLDGDPANGVPATQQLNLTATYSIDFLGTAGLNTIDPKTGQSSLSELDINTPGIYGYGNASDVATITTNTLVWNGVEQSGTNAAGTILTVSGEPGGAITNGPGTGHGTLKIDASRIVLGYPTNAQVDNVTTLDRTVLGFATVDLTATQEITGNTKGTLSVYEAQTTYGQPGRRGNLTLTTPLLAGEAGSVQSITAGGLLTIVGAASPAAPSTPGKGAEIDLAAAGIIDTGTIELPSGKLTMTATGAASGPGGGAVAIGDGAVLDLRGRTTEFFDQTRDGVGGTVVLQSTHGAVALASGGTIDVSAGNADAGSLTVTALGTATSGGAVVQLGSVSLEGTILGGSTGGNAGTITVDTGTLDDFSGLNTRLNTGGVTGARAFDIKTGSLLVGNDVRARDVTISVDAGSLEVAGTIDASSSHPGSISLSARDALILDTGSKLDAHATSLWRDSYGAPITAENTPHVVLTSSAGTLTMQPGIVIDVSSADGVARGHIDLNVPRTADNKDVQFSAPGSLQLTGAASVALYGWRSYLASVDPTNPNASIINQALLDRIDADSAAFDPRLTASNPEPRPSAALLARIANLQAAAGDAFHLRPGVEIDSRTANGDISIPSEINLAKYRYGATADPSVLGSGEPGALTIRAGRNLNINASISDGFGNAPDATSHTKNPDDNGWQLQASEPLGGDVVLPADLPADTNGKHIITLAAGSTLGSFANAASVALNYDVWLQQPTIRSQVTIPQPVTLAQDSTAIPAGGWIVTATIALPDGTIYRTGTILKAGTILPAGTQLAAGTRLPFEISIGSVADPNTGGFDALWKAGSNLQLIDTSSAPPTLARDKQLSSGAFIPAGSFLQFASTNATDPNTGGVLLRAETDARGNSIPQGSILPLAGMLAPGTMSWSMSFVAGADLSAADRLAVRPKSQLGGNRGAESQTQGSLILSDTHYGGLFNFSTAPAYSVVRTGTGDLNLVAGGDVVEYSLFGVYTAGTQTSLDTPGNPNADASFQLPRGHVPGSTSQYLDVPGDTTNSALEPYANPSKFGTYQAWYPDGGGDLSVTAGGGVYGDTLGASGLSNPLPSDLVGNWLWRQGTGSTTGVSSQSTAWWINFGTYVNPSFSYNSASNTAQLTGFVGFGTLGGGNVTIAAGGNAGETILRTAGQRSQGLVVAAASTGRVTADGLVQTGGGDITINVGGTLNGVDPTDNISSTYDGLGGTVTAMRGDAHIKAGQLGWVQLQYDGNGANPYDTRQQNPFQPTGANSQGGIIVVPGDSTVTIETMRDLVLAGAGDPGREEQANLTDVTTTNGTSRGLKTGVGSTTFSLWTSTTEIDLTSAGGDVTPSTQSNSNLSVTTINDLAADGFYYYPPILKVRADSGSIYYGYQNGKAYLPANPQSGALQPVELVPSSQGQLEFLAEGSIHANEDSIDISGAAAGVSDLPNPLNVTFAIGTFGVGLGVSGIPYGLFAAATDASTNLKLDTGTNLHAGDTNPVLFYAVAGDIIGLRTGEVLNYGNSVTPSIHYIAAKPVWIRAGQDIVATGTPAGFYTGSAYNFSTYPDQVQSVTASGAYTSGDLFLNNGPNDVSLVSAGRDILTSYIYVAGPGLLDVEAGRNLYQANTGILKSIGLVYGVTSTNNNSGAGITVTTGAGAAGPDYAAIEHAYLNPQNLADPNQSLTSSANSGRVAETYDTQLLAWLQQNYGYTGSAADALTAFNALPSEQQDVFLRQIFYGELLASGREYNDPASRRYKSYARGREAIALLFPTTDSAGQPVTYNGGLTMFTGNTSLNIVAGAGTSPTTSDAGISTLFGGTIQLLVPGGQTILGTVGLQPGQNSGLLTYGSGDIQAYSLGSVLLGQSRVFTTFGGAIQIWSAQGDINAGIGTKTAIVFQPALISYDNYGSVTLSPTVPSSGSGIATLAPIAGVAAGDVDLTAPLGTIDAGEAGIRVSGNLNLAAARIANAANLQVQGKTTGAPTVVVPNVGALSAAGAVAGAASKAASQVAQNQSGKATTQDSNISVEVLGFGE